MFRKGFMETVEAKMESETIRVKQYCGEMPGKVSISTKYEANESKRKVDRPQYKKQNCIECRAFIYVGYEYQCSQRGKVAIASPNCRIECNEFVKDRDIYISCLDCGYSSGVDVDGMVECRLLEGVSAFHPVGFASRCIARKNLHLLLKVRKPGNQRIL